MNKVYIFSYVEDAKVAWVHKVVIKAKTEQDALDIFFKEVGHFAIIHKEEMSLAEWRQWVIQ
jgi:hypothetical protein